MDDWGEQNIGDLTGRTALVTGGASGIGYETVRALAEHGAHVLLADRNVAAGEQAIRQIRAIRPDAQVEFQALDLSALANIRAFADNLLATDRPIDLLVNNAGIQPISERRETADGFELAFGIGHLGHFLLTALLMPLIRRQADARIVTVSSMVHGKGRIDWDDVQMRRGYSAQRAYDQTKLANLLFALTLQRRFDAAGLALRSMAAHPGVAQTSIGANRRSLGKFGLSDHIVSAVLSLVMPYLGQPASAGALPTLYAATAPEAQGGHLYGPQGMGEMKGPPGIARIRPSAQDRDTAERLWTLSEQLVGHSFTL